MKKNTILTTTLVLSVITGISIFAVSNLMTQDVVHPAHEELGYTPSDMSKAFPHLDGLKQGDASWTTTDIREVKDQVHYTIRGTVVSIGEGQEWADPTPQPENYDTIFGKNVKIPIDIKVQETKKTKSDVKRGDIITVTLTGKLLENILYLDGGEPQFEVGEEVVLHIAEDPNDIVGKNIKYVLLGEYGKYKIQNGKAFNEKFPQGKTIQEALEETQ